MQKLSFIFTRNFMFEVFFIMQKFSDYFYFYNTKKFCSCNAKYFFVCCSRVSADGSLRITINDIWPLILFALSPSMIKRLRAASAPSASLASKVIEEAICKGARVSIFYVKSQIFCKYIIHTGNSRKSVWLVNRIRT